MLGSRLFRNVRLHGFQLGFTLIETLVILMIIGVIAAVSVPSLTGYLNAAKVKTAISDIRITLQESQNQAIKSGQDCSTNVFLPSSSQEGKEEVTLDTSCVSQPRSIPKDIRISTNIQQASNSVPISSTPSLTLASVNPLHVFKTFSQVLTFGNLGDPWADTRPRQGSSGSSPSPSPSTLESRDETSVIQVQFTALGGARFDVKTNQSSPPDTTGKIIAFHPNQKSEAKRCIAISQTLGLTRIGIYQGDESLTPEKITDTGTCAALDWTKQ